MNRITIDELSGLLGDWREEGRPLYESLAATLTTLIRGGSLAPDRQLPSERALAGALRVSRGTVMAAYDQLRRSSLAATRQGSGTVVLRAGSPLSGPQEAHVATTLSRDSIFRGFLGLEEGQIDLCGAYWTGEDTLPEEAFEAAGRQLPDERQSHGYSAFGLAVLREAIAEDLTASGLPTGPNQLLVTTGAQFAIALVAEMTIAAGDIVVTEAATYPGALEAFSAHHARVVPVGLSEVGPDLVALQQAVAAHAPRLVYLIPSVNNPTGVVMPGAARARLAELATNWETLLIDDRTLADTQWEGTPPSPLAAYADEETACRIITIGSTSKTLWGGLRIGWIRAEGPILSRLARLKSILDHGTPIPSQLMAAELLRRGDELYEARREGLRHRCEVLSDALTERIDGWTWRTPSGGLSLWVDLGEASAAEFCRIAADHGLSAVPGSVASPADAARSRMRVPFGQPEDVLITAAGRLGDAWEDYHERLHRHPGDHVSMIV